MIVRVASVALLLLAGACGGPPPATTQSPPAEPPTRIMPDSSSSVLVPAGFGTLKQEDVAIVLTTNGVRVTAIPLDEPVIRLLAPDSYRTLRARLESKRQTIIQRASMRGVREPRVWLVRFDGLAPDARFVPTDLTVTSGGREFRPFDVIPLTAGFGEQRLQPRDIQTALLLFDEGLDVSQPVVVTMGAERNTDWDWIGSDGILKKLDTERASIRARTGGRPP